ncbi:MAG: hypothetical protein ONB44_24915 [candidate division KSB1 bacterium]|nr:hypothetical protein [candidate division KSB1 bacterium]MDZ7313571.1 hypothetical protein [candidate division KSB1 bacterium]
MLKQIFRISLTGATAGFLVFTSCKFQKSSPARLYTDPQYGFRITSPDSGWILTDETGISEVLVIIKSEAMAEDFIPNVTIAVEILAGMMTAIEYGEKNQKSLTAQGYEVLSWEKTVINHNAFYDLQCLNRHVSPAMRFRYLCLVRNQVGFIIVCTAPEKYYANFARDFEFIVKSFRFL